MNKRMNKNYGKIVSGRSRIVNLPFFGSGFDRYMTLDYDMNDEKYRKNRVKDFIREYAEILKSGDGFSNGKVLDSQIQNDIRHERAHLAEENGRSHLQAQQIKGVQKVQKEMIDRKVPEKEENVSRIKTELAQLSGVKAQFELRIGSLHIPVAIPVTLAAMGVDAILNYSYLQGILYQNMFLLIITVICMSVMSDASAYVFGTLYSRKDEDFMDPLLYRVIMGGLVGCFLLSVVAGVMIRFGSMNATYGTINASGDFVAKESYSVAEWGVTLVTSFLTTATALISLAVSVDKNQHLAARKRTLERELEKEEAELNACLAERSALESAADPEEYDLERRQAAFEHLEGLEVDLKLKVRQMLIVQQNQASYTDAMTASSERVMLKSIQNADSNLLKTVEADEAISKTHTTAQKSAVYVIS